MTESSESQQYGADFVADLGQKVKAFRKAKQLTQSETAQLCGVGTRFISDLENGKATIEMGKAAQVLHALDLELNLTDTPRRAQQLRERRQNEALSFLGNHKALRKGQVKKLIPVLTETLAKALGAEFAGVWFFNEAKDVLQVQDEYVLSEDLHEPEDNYTKEAFPAYFEELLQARTLVEDYTLANIRPSDKEWQDEIDKYKITATLDTPLVLDGEIVGIISCEHIKVAHTWAPDEIAFHGQVAAYLTEAMRNERYRKLKDQLRIQNQRARQQQTLIMDMVSDSAFRQGHFKQGLQHCLQKVQQHFQVDTVSFWQLQDEQLQRGYFLEADAESTLSLDAAELSLQQQPCLLVDLPAGQRLDASAVIQQSLQIDGHAMSVMESCINLADEVVAIIGIARAANETPWPVSDANFLSEISAQLGQLIINSRLKDSERAVNERLLYAGNLQKVISDLSTNKNVTNPSNIAEAVKLINEVVTNALDLEGCGVWVTDQDGNTLNNIDYYERSAEYHYVDASYQRDDFPNFFNALESEKTVAADDAQNDERTSEFLEEEQSVYGISSSMDSVIRLHGRTAGILNVEHYGSKRSWTSDEVAFHGAVADLVGFILANLEHEQQERERSEHLRLENERIGRLEQQNKALAKVAMSSAIAEGDVEKALAAICQSMVEVLATQRAEVWWFYQDSGHITIAQGYDKDRAFYQQDEPYDLHQSPGYLQFLTSGRNIVFDDSTVGDEASMYFGELVRDKSVVAGIDVAIRIRGESIGLISVEHCVQGRVWEQDEVNFVTSLSDQVAQVLLNKEKLEADQKEAQRRTELEQNQKILVDLATHEDVINGNIQAVADLINKTASQQLNVYNCSIWMFDYERKISSLISSYLLDSDEFESDLERYTHSIDVDDLFYTTLKSERTIAVSDVHNDPVTKAFADLFYTPDNITSTLESAIRVQGKMVGGLNLDHRGEPKQWSTEAISFCAELADIMAHALMNNERIQSQQSYKALAEKREEMDAIISSSRFIVIEWGIEDNVEFVSDNISLFGYQPEDFYHDPKLFINILHPYDYEKNLAYIETLEQDPANHQYTIEYRLKDKDDNWRWVEEHTTIYRDEQGEVSHYHGVLHDITERIESAHQLLMLSSAVEHSASGVFIVDMNQLVDYVNPAFCQMIGYDVADLIGEDILKVRVHDGSKDNFKAMLASAGQGRSWHGELEVCKPAGGTVWSLLSTSPIKNELGELTHFVAVCEDITEQKQHQRQMEQLAYYDTLTGLANRRLFKDHLDALVTKAQHHNEHSALLFLDLDRFKIINDTLGHDAGDQLLITVSERLQTCVAEGDIVSRLGGDEFTIILKNIEQQPDSYVAAVSEKIIAQLSEPIQLGREEVVVTTSIGITIMPTDSQYSSELMKNADMAMYKAKSLGRNNYQFYTPDLHEDAYDQMHLETEMQTGMQRGEFVLHYQPIFDHQQRIVAVEALVRWQHPSKGLLNPEAFIEAANDIGLLIDLEKIVLDKACHFACDLSSQNNGSSFPVCINISSVMLFSDQLVPFLTDSINRCGLQQGALHLEVAEDIVVAHRDKLKPLFEEIKALGIKISVDDFGSGYSALNYLRDLHIDSIKIDQHFIQGTESNAQDQQIVPAIIDLAHKLDIEVIGEGVETDSQLAFLNQNQCDYHQGHLFEQAMTEQELLKQLKSSSKH